MVSINSLNQWSKIQNIAPNYFKAFVNAKRSFEEKKDYWKNLF
jgi:hypothetical protein